MKLAAYDSSDLKKNFKVIRTDDYSELPGEIIRADDDTGECAMLLDGEAKIYTLGPNGIKVLSRAR